MTGVQTCALPISLLKRALTFGYQNRKIPAAPYIAVPAADNARKGFLKAEEYKRLLALVPDYLKAAFTVAYDTGLRREELFGLRWEQLDLVDGFIRLEAGDTKTGVARQVNLASVPLEMLRVQKTLRDQIDKEFPFVFFRRPKANECKLVRLGDFRKAWEKDRKSVV